MATVKIPGAKNAGTLGFQIYEAGDYGMTVESTKVSGTGDWSILCKITSGDKAAIGKKYNIYLGFSKTKGEKWMQERLAKTVNSLALATGVKLKYAKDSEDGEINFESMIGAPIIVKLSKVEDQSQEGVFRNNILSIKSAVSAEEDDA
jgi:hypothetical protein